MAKKKLKITEKHIDTLIRNIEDASSQAYSAMTQLKESITTLIMMHETLEGLKPEPSETELLAKIKARRKSR